MYMYKIYFAIETIWDTPITFNRAKLNDKNN